MAWYAVALVVFIGFWLPVLIALARRAEKTGLVLLLSLLGLVTGVMWFAALIAAFIVPRRVPLPPARGQPGGPATWQP